MMQGVIMAKRTVAWLSLVALAIGAIALGGCNTVEGAGKDIKAGGQAIEKAADRNKSY
jgi:entericidin B